MEDKNKKDKNQPKNGSVKKGNHRRHQPLPEPEPQPKDYEEIDY